MKRASQRFTKQHLTRALEKVASLLSGQAGLLDAYKSSIEGSAFLRIAGISSGVAETTGTNEQIDQVCLDSCVLLVVSLANASESFTNDSNELSRLAASATVRIADQYTVLENVDQAIWQAAREAFDVATELAQRDRLDVAERILFALDKGTRKTIGAYFTPVGLADQVIARTAENVRKNLGLTEGFSDSTPRGEILKRLDVEVDIVSDTSDAQPFLRFLDPAAGVGTFLIACLNRMKSDFASSFGSADRGDTEEAWPEFLAGAIPRILGIELHPALATICHFRLVSYYRDQIGQMPSVLVPIHCSDALCESNSKQDSEIDLACVSIVVGNPPFGSLTANSNSWIEGLLRGEVDGVSFFEVDGQPLNERKHWLHDDYVKFFRLGQYLIRRNGAGVIGFVSNRSYVDNLTFRAMRWQMLQQFAEIEINELAGHGEHFPIVANVASGVFCTHALDRVRPRSVVEYQNEVSTTRFSPGGPEFLFRPTVAVAKHYLDSISLPDAMPFHGSVAITARDFFVTDIDRDVLKKRVEEFCDLAIPDDEIRARYFHRTRSRRYPAGDTRGWKMSAAREQLARLDWESHIRCCDYRPFDRRWILWCDLMIDWPRNQQMSAFDIPGNFALLARRQSPSDQPACYFWASSRITIDGILRSDNRGNETMFPVWVRDPEGKPIPNFSESFLSTVRERWNRLGIECVETDLPLKLSSYIYGLFHSAAYRETFHQPLTSGFPRVLLGLDREETELLVDVGRELLDCHLALSDTIDSNEGKVDLVATNAIATDNLANTDLAADKLIGSIKYSQEKRQVHFGGISFDDIAQEDWEFRVGTHQVIRKWVKERKGQGTAQMSDEFRQVVKRVQRTRSLMQEIEKVDVERRP